MAQSTLTERSKGIFKTDFQLIINGVIKDQITINSDDMVKAFWKFHAMHPELNFSLDNIWKIL